MITPEQQAKEIVEMFLGACSQFDWDEQTGWRRNKSATIKKATEAAILHVEKVIEVLSEIRFKDKFIMEDINRYQQLLTILVSSN